ncbi:peptidase S24 [Ignatzschineria cameli]|uniref:XRE family transcriptional regulator n=1 Tax=Ignatzschineria cameli TaxID=2182793 RepID=UPI000D60B563|nr:LexA family transcriptional regulator [Ignatzschineria cameli]PWD89578.1 peptidase S24 [Ignatzschineria cameli]
MPLNNLIVEQGARIKEERIRIGFSKQGDFIDAIGASKTTVYNWERGGTRVDSEDLAKMHSLGMDITYIVTGQRCNQEKSISSDEYIYVPVYDVEASAGHGREALNETPTRYHCFRRRWANFHGLSEKDLLVIKIKGDSMEPTLEDGSHIVVNQASKEPIDGRIFVVRNGNSLLVKYVQTQIGGTILLISENSFYPPIVLRPEDLECDNVEILGEVVHGSRDFI